VVSNCLLWSRIEPCCSVIAACLPTLWPLVQGRSPESLVNSVQSVFSIRSADSLAGSRRKPQEFLSDGSDVSNRSEAKREWYRLHSPGTATVENVELGAIEYSDDEIRVQKSFATRFQNKPPV
ncbi:MAG: hypothetical protein M1818_003036, partial [Claussenomyces sp. TS43310]